MCRIEERVYIGSDGRRQIFEDKFPCDKSHRGKLCSKVKRRTTEYFPKQPPPVISRDDASSPLSSNNPPTPPAGTGSYLVEERRPSLTGARPSTRDSKIIIEFGGSKDGKSKKYSLATVANKTYKRSSLGGTSVTSNEGAIESPGSEASYTIRTGFADVSVPPTDHLGQSHGYRTRHDVPRSHHRHVSSASSHTTSSQPPSLCTTSEPESPSASAQQLPGYPRTVVHNSHPGVAPPSPNVSRAAAPPSPSYRINTVVPQTSSRDNLGADGLTPLDYSDFVNHSASSHASSGRAAAPEITDRAADRERRRKREDEKKRQEEADRRLAQELEKQEEVKQVRFVLGRAEERANQRGENKFAESEKRRAEEREEARQRKKDQEARPTAKKPEREKTKPPTRDFNKRPGHHRRSSMTQADIDEQHRLRVQEEAQMAREREATEQREREERAAAMRSQQHTSDYWDPRGGERYPVPNSSSGVGRRGSVSGRRPSITGNPPPMGGIGRTNSTRRVSIIQQAPPANLAPLTTQFPQQQQQQQQQYSTRPPSSQYQNAPSVFSPGSYNSSSRPPSARHASQHENPFAQPPTRTSHTSQDSNPFALPPTRNVHPTHPQHENPFAAQPSVFHAPPETTRDPWDNRDLRDALPRANQHHTLQRRGEEVINRATDDRPRSHGRAQQATRNLGAAQGFEDDYESSSGEEEQKLAGKGARMGFGKSRRY